MSDNRGKNLIVPLIIAGAVISGFFLGAMMARNGARSQLMNISHELSRSNKLSQTLALIDRLYVDPVDLDSMVEVLMPELMGELDPHSVYIAAEDMSKANESLEGEFDGIGVVFNMATDTVIVLNVITNGPSYKAGVQNGDRIIRIDDSLVAGQKIRQDDIVRMLRGKRGTKVTLSVERQGLASLVPLEITRGKIPIKSVDAAFMIAPEVGFVKLSSFSRNTHSDIVKALDGLRAEGMSKLIFDLRGNSGGFLDQAIELANEFLPAGKLIVYTEGRNGKRIEEFSDGRGGFQDTELVFLIDEGSASSSEILAGAIQDNDRGTIVGRRSFGKGLVQQQIPFNDGSAVRITTSRYYTPTGRSIQKPYSKDENYNDEIYARYLNNEMFTADSIHFDENLKFQTPGGKTVYGGGGIMPDIYVPIDTTGVTKYFYEVAGRNIIYKFTIDYADRHRERINNITTVAELNAMLDADKNLLDDFVAFAARNGVKADQKQIRESAELITAQLRAYIGRNTPLEDSGFYSNIYPIDPIILRAIETLTAG